MGKMIAIALFVAACGNTGSGGLSDGDTVDCHVADHWQPIQGQCFARRGDVLYTCATPTLEPDSLKPGCPSAKLVDGGLTAECVWRFCDPPPDAGP